MKPEQKGVYSKLKDSSVSWSEKLSLARSAWDSPDCVIPNKQQILLDWIVQELINEGRKAANSHASKEVCGLWKLLLHVFQSQQLVLHGRIPVILKPQLLQVFSDAFSHAYEESALEESFINAVISCCYTVVSTPQLASSLLAKFETYVTFLSSLLSFYIPICAGQSKEELHILVEVCLKKYLLVQRQQANQRKVFSAMCQQLLAPLTSLHHFLSAAQDQCRPNSWWTDKAQDILQLVKFALKRSLFHKDHIPEYQQALKVAREEKGTESEEPVIKKPRISTYTKLLFDKLWEVTVSSNSVTTVKGLDTEKIARKEAGLEILPFLYEEFVIAIRKLNPSTSAVEFDFFTEVCEMLGILNGASKDVASVCTLLYKLLECVHRYDIYQVADDSLNGSSQFNWMKNLLEVLIHTGAPCDSEAMFQCLDVFMKLNHSLLEPHLEIIWTMLWKAEKSGGASYNCLLSSLISTYVKLRQFEKLVLAILVSLRNLELSTRNFSALFQERFSTAIQGLPFGQIAGIWNIFNEEIKESYLNKLQSLSEQFLVKKSRKKKSSSNAVVVWKKLEYVMSVFHAFLLNISFGGIGEQSRRKSSVQSAGQLLRHTVQDVLEPLIELDNREIPYNERESACFSTILLQYTLGELEIFLSKFQRFEDDKGTEILLPSVRWSAETGGFAPNKAKDATIINGDRGRLCYLKNALCIQSIRFMLLRNKKLVQEPGLYAEFQRLVSCVCSSVGDKVLSSTSWDTQVLTICEENAPVALWDLVSRNAVILLPSCNADQQLTLAQLLIKTVGEGSQANRHATAGSITMSDVSETMIQSTAFHEMLAIQTCTVCALWGELKKSIHSTCSADGLGGRLSKLLQDIATPQFPKADNQNEEGICKNTVKDEDNIIDDEEENDNVGDDENAEGSSDNESNGEEDLGEEEETSQKQYVGSLSAFYAVGCELIRISNSALFSEDFEANLSGAECYRLLKVLGYLPLDWLSDDNHTRCLIGLFTCDMVFTSVLLKVFHFEYLKSEDFEKRSNSCLLLQQGSPDILKPLMLSRQLLTVMFDGCFSRKRFIPHHVIDLESVHAWLISSSTKLWQKLYKDPNISSGVLALLRVTRSLLYSTVKYLLKAPSKSTSNEHSTIEKLQDDLQTISKEVLQNSKHSVKKALSSHHAISIIIQGILAVCEEVLTSKTSSTKMIQISSDIVIKLGPTLLELLKAVMQASQTKRRGNKDQNSKEGSESKWHDMLLEFPVLIDSFKSLLHIFSVSEKSRKLQRVNEELKKCEWQNVFDVALAAVIHHLFGRNMTLPFSGNEIGTVHSSLHFLKVVCQSCSKVELHLPDDFHLRLLASGLHFLRLLELNTSKSAEGIENKEGTNASQRDLLETVMMDGRKDLESKDIAEDGYSLVVSLLERCDPVLLPELLEGLCDEITTKTVNKDSLDRLYVSLQVWFRLLSGRFTKERRKELRPKLPKVLFALQFLLKELKTSNLRILHLAIDVMAKILSLGKGMLLPHNALLVLHSGLMIRLDACGNSFPQLFESQYTLLSTLLFQHSDAVYGAVHVFITCVRNLLCFLIQSCGERMEIAPENGSKTKAAHLKPAALTQSAQRMARLYQEISSHKSTFSKYSPYMIADYIHSVQSVAIPSVIREALIPGVYCLLDICGEHELSLMHAVLEKGARELFHSLHADYTKYHKFKGKV